MNPTFTPRPYQEMAIQRMVESDYQLVALTMGAGKTAATLSAIDQLMFDRFDVGRTLVVSPLRVAQLVWHTEAAKWSNLQHLRVVRLLGTAKQRTDAMMLEADINVINFQNLAWLVDLVEATGQPWPWDCVVLDENVGLKDRGSVTFKALKKVRDQVRRMYLLTGTPTPNGLLQLWPQISILDRGQRLGTGIGKYRDRWFLPDKRNGQVVYTWKPRDGAKEEIFAAIADMTVSVEAGVQMPDRIDNVIEVDIGSSARARMRELQEDMVTGEITAANAAVLAGKAAQMANGAAYTDDGSVEHIHDAKLEALEEIVEQGQPVLVLVSYRHDIARIKERWPQAREFDGEKALRDWQAGKIDILVMNPASGGHGVDGLQFGGCTMVWFGLPWALDLYEQANARIVRPGQKSTVVVHHLVAKGTIDERIVKLLQTKGDLQEGLLEAVRAIFQAREGVDASEPV